MKGISAIGMTFGLVMMTAPLWMPRLGIGGFSITQAPTGQNHAYPTSGQMPTGARPVSDAVAGVMAALEQARGTVGAPHPAVIPAANLRPVENPAAVIAEVCEAVVRAGHMTMADCRAQVALAFAASAAPAPKGDVERAMQGNRISGTPRPTRNQPGAKFVRVEP